MDKIITATGLQQFRELLEGRFEIKNKDNSELFGGMGKLTLSKNIQGTGNEAKNVLDQTSMPALKSNYIFKVEDDFDLDGSNVVIPSDCILDFEGGSISNGSLKLDNTLLGGNIKFGANVEFSNNSTCSNETFKQSWFENNDVDAFIKFMNTVDSTTDSLKYEFASGSYNPTVQINKNTSKDVTIIGNGAVLNYDTNSLAGIPEYLSSGKCVLNQFQCPQPDWTLPLNVYNIVFSATRGAKSLQLNKTLGLKAGDHIIIRNTHVCSFMPTRNYQDGEYSRIKDINYETNTITLDSALLGDYSDINIGEDNSEGCVVVKCNFNYVRIDNLTVLGDLQFYGSEVIAFRVLSCQANINNLIVKDFTSCFQTYNIIDSQITNCVFNTISKKADSIDSYGLTLCSCQNVTVLGGDYRGASHGLDVTSSYGSSAYLLEDLLGNGSVVAGSIKYNAVPSRLIHIQNTAAYSYKESGTGLHAHDGVSNCIISGNVCDQIGVGGSGYIISTNIVLNAIGITGFDLSSRITNNICGSIVYNVKMSRADSNNPDQVKFDNVKISNTKKDSLVISDNTVKGQINITMSQTKSSQMYLYLNTGTKARTELINLVKDNIINNGNLLYIGTLDTIYNKVRSLNNFSDISRIANQSVTSEYTIDNKAEDVLKAIVYIKNLDVAKQNAYTELFNSLVAGAKKVLVTDNVLNILDSGKIIITGNKCENITHKYNINSVIQKSIYDPSLSDTTSYNNTIKNVYSISEKEKNGVITVVYKPLSTLFRLKSINAVTTDISSENDIMTTVKNNIITDYLPQLIFGKYVFVDNNIIEESADKHIRIDTANDGTSIARNNTFIRYSGTYSAQMQVISPMEEIARIGGCHSTTSRYLGVNEYDPSDWYDLGKVMATTVVFPVAEPTSYDAHKAIYVARLIPMSSLQILHGNIYSALSRRTGMDVYFLKDGNKVNYFLYITENTLDDLGNTVEVTHPAIYPSITSFKSALDDALNSKDLIYGGGDAQGVTKVMRTKPNSDTLLDYYQYLVAVPSNQDYQYMLMVTNANSDDHIYIEGVSQSFETQESLSTHLIGTYANTPTGDSLYPGLRYFCTDAVSTNSVNDAPGIEIIYTGSKWVDCLGADIEASGTPGENSYGGDDFEYETDPGSEFDDLDWED